MQPNQYRIIDCHIHPRVDMETETNGLVPSGSLRQQVEALCQAVPELSFVLAHPGGGKDEILPRVALVARLPNLHLDISGSGIDRLGMLRRAVDTAGKEKILFGSDYPINNPAVYVHGLLFESLSDDERTAIFAGNFLRLTGAA